MSEIKEWRPTALLKTTAVFFAGKGVLSPRLDAEVLLAAVLNCSRLDLYAQKADAILSPAQLTAYRDFVRRRSEHEPVARILGKKEFMSLEFAITPDVLSPRPETEILVECVLKQLQPTPKIKKSDLIFHSLESRAREFLIANRSVEHSGLLPAEILSSLDASVILPDTLDAAEISQCAEDHPPEFSCPRILEIGCGSGCIAVALAKNFPTAQIVAIDISDSALEVAKQNAAAHRVERQIEFRQSDLFAALCPQEKFNFLVANPPYIPIGDREKLPAEVRNYDPEIALFGGNDGLRFYREIINRGAEFLDFSSGNAYLDLEIGADQSAAVRDLILAKFPHAEIMLIPDYAGIDRVISARLAIL